MKYILKKHDKDMFPEILEELMDWEDVDEILKKYVLEYIEPKSIYFELENQGKWYYRFKDNVTFYVQFKDDYEKEIKKLKNYEKHKEKQ